MTLRYGSVCSGIEAASVAWEPLGWTPEFFAEIEAFPSEVLAERYGSNLPGEAHSRNAPPNLGDITNFMDWPDANIDVLVGGTPCQAFSVAGLRKGLADPRGNLALTYLGILDRYRPTWMVWENVPGVLSSWTGDEPPSDLVAGQQWESTETSDFGCFLEALRILGYGFAYRVLDAQYITVDGYGRAVPQRRERVFVVGYLGDWRRAGAVLFEQESLSRHLAPRREAGKSVAASARDGAAFGGGNRSGAIDAAACLTAKGQRIDFEVETFIAEPFAPPITSNPYGDHESREGLLLATRDVAGTLTSSLGRRNGAPNDDNPADYLVAHSLRGEGFDASEDGTGRGTPLVPVAVAVRGREGGGAIELGDDCAFTLRASQGGSDKPHALVPFDTTQITSRANRSVPKAGDPCHPLAAGAHAPAIAFQERGREGGRSLEIGGDVAFALTAPNGGGRAQEKNILAGWAVRRLTPLECERLQGFPDGYTAINRKGKPAADGPRYKALGNSMACNVMRWIGRRIEMVDALDKELGQ